MSALRRMRAQMQGLVTGRIVAQEHGLDGSFFRDPDSTLRLELQPVPSFKGPPFPVQIRVRKTEDRRRTTGAQAGEQRDTSALVELVAGYLEGNVEDLQDWMADDDQRLLRLLFSSGNWDKDETGCENCTWEGTEYKPAPGDDPRALLIQAWRLELHDNWGGSV